MDIVKHNMTSSHPPFFPSLTWFHFLFIPYSNVPRFLYLPIYIHLISPKTTKNDNKQHPIDKPIWARQEMANITLTAPMTDRLQKAIRIETVSSGYRQYNVGALDDFQQFLQRRFPRIHSSVFISQEKVLTYSLLYTITGEFFVLDRSFCSSTWILTFGQKRISNLICILIFSYLLDLALQARFSQFD